MDQAFKMASIVNNYIWLDETSKIFFSVVELTNIIFAKLGSNSSS